jgi:uncharacterized membrane protein
VFVISTATVPLLFLLLYLSTFVKKKEKHHIFPESILNLMICFSIGSLLGDIALHIFPFIYSETIHSKENIIFKK